MDTPKLQQEEIIEPSFAYQLTDGIYHLKDKGLLCNVTIEVQGQKFPCHKVVLASISSYFKARFTSSIRENKSAEVALHGMEAQVFETILGFIYTGKCKISKENAQAVMDAANKLQIFTLIKICGKYIARNLTPENCLPTWQYANTISCRELIQKTKQFSLKNFLRVPFFSVTCLSKDVLIQLISSDSLNIQSEDNVAKMALQWIEAEPERETNAEEVLFHVRFSFISSRYMMALMDNEIIKQKESILKLIRQAKLFHADPTMFFELPYPQASPRASLKKQEYVSLLVAQTGESDDYSFSQTPSLAQPKWTTREFSYGNHKLAGAAICTVNCNIMVSGGENDPRRLTIYDKELQPRDSIVIGQMLSGRRNHTMVSLRRILIVIGGLRPNFYQNAIGGGLRHNFDQNAIDSSVHVYSIRFNKWHQAGYLLTGVMQHASVSFQGKIYTFGGTTATSGSLQDAINKVQIYSPQTKACVLGQEIPTAISKCSATVMEESIFVVGLEEITNSDSNSDEEKYYERYYKDIHMPSWYRRMPEDGKYCTGNRVFYQFKPLVGVWIKLNPPTNITHSALCTHRGKIWNIVVGSRTKVYSYNSLDDIWESNSKTEDSYSTHSDVKYLVKCIQLTH